jgi:hypothetical protein
LAKNAVPIETRVGRLLPLGLTSAVVSFLGLPFFQLWSAVMEGMRVGNPDGHMSSYRATTPIGEREIAALFVGGMLLFWLVAALHRPDSAKGRDRGVQLR